jgi:NADH-quinone oxidoreductase subunit N
VRECAVEIVWPSVQEHAASETAVERSEKLLVNLHDLVSQLLVDTTGSADGGLLAIKADSSLGAFGPELVLCGTILALLLLRLFRITRNLDAAWVALVGAGLALAAAAPWQLLSDPGGFGRMEIFTGMLVFDGFTVVMRGVLLAFLVLFVLFTMLSGLPEREDRADIYVLALGATLGFCLMAAANHLLMVFLAVEMASVPSYVLAGMLKRERPGSEASLKYAVYGAGAAGIMLYGISLIAGLVNAVHLPTVAERLALALPTMNGQELTVLALACLMVAVGLAFKLSAVPFHFWCPDVFGGASAEIGGFLSVASKAAALALLIRVVIGFGWVSSEGVTPGRESIALVRQNATAETPVAEQAGHAGELALVFTSATQADAGQLLPPAVSPTANATLEPVRANIAWLLALLAIVTCTFGNLAAYGQTNIKRLLAYSTIAHAGYMMMAVPPVLVLLSSDVLGARQAVGALLIYITAYLFMNLGAFAVVAFMRNAMKSEEIADYAGLLRSSPGVAICFSAILLSLVGLPPLSGFVGKFAIFAALTDAFRATGKPYLMVLLVAGGVNSAISLFYYLRIVRLMTMQAPPTSERGASIPLASPAGMYLVLLTIPTVMLIVGWEPLNSLIVAAVQTLFA